MDNRKQTRQLTPLGRWVKAQSVIQGIGLSELAARVGTNKHYISSIIHGMRSGKKYAKQIVHELGGDFDKLKDII